MTRTRRYQDSGFWDDWFRNHNGQELEWSAPVSEAILSKIKPVLKELHGDERRPLRVCELGCGTSSLAVALVADRSDGEISIVGVDFSQEAISCSEKRHPELEWRCCDALKLTDEFDLGSFDCVVAKTLLDCFLARGDAAESIRLLFQQVRAVLKENGCFMLFDRAPAPQIIGRGKVEQVRVPQGVTAKLVNFRTLRAMKTDPASDAGKPSGEPVRLELELPPLHQHVVIHRTAGCGVLVVWTADEVAQEAGLLVGDRLLAFDICDGKGLQAGEPDKMAKVLRSGAPPHERVRVLLERSVATNVALRGAASQSSKVDSRRSLSQSDYLLRQQRARTLRTQSCGKRAPPPRGRVAAEEPTDSTHSKSRSCKALPKLFPNVDDHISTQVCVAKGLFV